MPLQMVMLTLEGSWFPDCCRPGNITSTRAMWDCSLKKFEIFSQLIASNQANSGSQSCSAQILSSRASRDMLSQLSRTGNGQTRSQDLFLQHLNTGRLLEGLLQSTVSFSTTGSKDLPMHSTTDSRFNLVLVFQQFS